MRVPTARSSESLCDLFVAEVVGYPQQNCAPLAFWNLHQCRGDLRVEPVEPSFVGDHIWSLDRDDQFEALSRALLKRLHRSAGFGTDSSEITELFRAIHSVLPRSRADRVRRPQRRHVATGA